MVALAGKSGRVYTIDRATQLLAFNTPATTLDNDQVPLNEAWMHVCPGVNGGAQIANELADKGVEFVHVECWLCCSHV